MQYAARHPARVARLVLVGPSTRAVGLMVSPSTRLESARLRHDEPWFDGAYAALEAIAADRAADSDWDAAAPFGFRRWDDATQRLHARLDQHDNPEARQTFGADGAFDPEQTRAALGAVTAPVLVASGEFDLNTPPPVAAELAGLFPHGTLVVEPAAGHYPWLDDPEHLSATIDGFLQSAVAPHPEIGATAD